VLKAYYVVCWYCKFRDFKSSSSQEMRVWGQELEQWVSDTLAQTSGIIQTDLKEKSWNLIAQIETGEETEEALDLFLKRAVPAQWGQPTAFDLKQIHAQMRSPRGTLCPVGQRGARVSLKPQKTSSPAFDAEGNYLPGRSREILAEARGSQLLRQASMLAIRFLAQPDTLRAEMARSMMFGTYDGVEPALREGLRALVTPQGTEMRENLSGLALLELAYAAIERAHQPEARQMAVLLNALVCQLFELETEPPVLTGVKTTF